MNKDRLFNKDFTLLWLGQTVSEIGNSAGNIALLWWVTTVTGSVIALGTLAMIKGVVAVLIAPFAGAIVDRINRKQVIVVTDLLQGIIYFFLAYLTFHESLNINIVYVFGALSTVIAQFFEPAIGASIPLILPDKQLTRGNSIRQMSTSIVKIIGYAAGGIGIGIFGIPMLFLLNGISFLASSISEVFITIPKIVNESRLPTTEEILSDIRIGFNYVKENKTLYKLIKLVMVVNMLLVPILLLMPIFLEDYMGVGSEVLGFIFSGQMVGTLIGAILMSAFNISEKYPSIIRWGLVGMGSLLLIIPFLPYAYWQAHIAVFISISILNVIFNITAMSVLQRSTPKEHLGKIFGFISTLSNGLTPATQGLSGIVAKYISIPIIYTVTSLGVIVTGTRFAFNSDLVGWFIKHDKRETSTYN